MRVRYRKELDVISPYVPGKPVEDVRRELGLEQVVKLASNENPYGFSPRVREAILRAVDNINRYPDGNATLLKEKVAAKYGLRPEMVLPTSGADEMLDLIAKTFIEQGSEVVLAQVTFPRYLSTSQMMGAELKIVPMRGLAYDAAAFKRAITPETRLVWLCNPNNPTGSYLSRTELEDLLAAVSPETLVVYDEAYQEFATAPDFPHNSLAYLREYENLLILKTLSKAYGLAGLRVGFAFGDPALLDLVNKIRNPFNVTYLTQMAALAALDDEQFVARAVEENSKSKHHLYGEFDRLGIEYGKTEANHIMFNAKKDGAEVFNELLRRGIIVRPAKGTWLRVSLGTPQENKQFIAALTEVLA
ncbi:MAG TPA: histidinol-phosphate transaminase [Firmicutes bacterium]|nr:histidinol-phosphate transaminase [Bacillota bacterium]